MHLDIVLSLNAIADAASSTARPTCVRDELENMTDSGYESDPGLKIGDIQTASDAIDDMHNDSDTEGVSPHRSAPALWVKKLFRGPADLSAKLLAIQSSTRP